MKKPLPAKHGISVGASKHVSLGAALRRSSGTKSQLSGDRNYTNPPMWELTISPIAIILRPRSRPPVAVQVLLFILVAVLAVLLWRTTSARSGWIVILVGMAIIAGVQATFMWNGRKPAWIEIDLNAETVYLPRAGLYLDRTSVVTFEVVSGFNPLAHMEKDYISELNLIAKDETSNTWVLPLVGRQGANSLDQVSQEISAASKIPLVKIVASCTTGQNTGST